MDRSLEIQWVFRVRQRVVPTPGTHFGHEKSRHEALWILLLVNDYALGPRGEVVDFIAWSLVGMTFGCLLPAIQGGPSLGFVPLQSGLHLGNDFGVIGRDIRGFLPVLLEVIQ